MHKLYADIYDKPKIKPKYFKSTNVVGSKTPFVSDLKTSNLHKQRSGQSIHYNTPHWSNSSDRMIYTLPVLVHSPRWYKWRSLHHRLYVINHGQVIRVSNGKCCSCLSNWFSPRNRQHVPNIFLLPQHVLAPMFLSTFSLSSYLSALFQNSNRKKVLALKNGFKVYLPR